MYLFYFTSYFIFNSIIQIKNPYIYNIHIVSFIHSLIITLFSNYLLIYDTNTFLNITLYKEKEVNELYKIIPIFTLCYSFFHIYDVFKLKIDFIIHGLLLLVFSLYCNLFNKNHYLSVALIIESSTIFMHLNYAISSIFLKLLFTFTFILYRGLLFPYLTYQYINNNYNNYNNILNIEYEFMFILFIAFSFNILNFYWIKLIFNRLIYKIM
jgi:hypothetical protein